MRPNDKDSHLASQSNPFAEELPDVAPPGIFGACADAFAGKPAPTVAGVVHKSCAQSDTCGSGLAREEASSLHAELRAWPAPADPRSTPALHARTRPWLPASSQPFSTRYYATSAPATD